jgi:hypothetical protein
VCDVDQNLRGVHGQRGRIHSFGRDLPLRITGGGTKSGLGLVAAQESYIVSDRVVVRASCAHDSATCFNSVLVFWLVCVIEVFDVHHLVKPYDVVVHVLGRGTVSVVRTLVERYAAPTSWNIQQQVR